MLLSLSDGSASLWWNRVEVAEVEAGVRQRGKKRGGSGVGVSESYDDRGWKWSIGVFEGLAGARDGRAAQGGSGLGVSFIQLVHIWCGIKYQR